MAKARNVETNQLTPLIQRLNEVLEDITMKELAEKAGIPASTISAIANGSNPRPKTLKAIAEASGKSVEWFLNGTEPVEPTGYQVPLFTEERREAIVKLDDVLTHHFNIPHIIMDRLNINPLSARIFFAKGNAMSPTLNDGDMMIVNTAQRELVDGGIFLFKAKNLYVRTFKDIAGEGWVAEADNPSYDNSKLLLDFDTDILGRVVWSDRRY